MLFAAIATIYLIYLADYPGEPGEDKADTYRYTDDPPEEEVIEYVEPDPPTPIIFPPDQLNLENVLIMSKQRRQIVHQPDMQRIYNWIEEREPTTLDATMLFDSSRRHNLSREEAAEDVAVFFDLLRHIYAAYHYFGGDRVFLPIRNEVQEEINRREWWTDNQLFELIRSRLLHVIFDYHIRLNSYTGSVFVNPHNNFIWNTPFDRSEQGFSKRESGLYVSYVAGHDKDDLFRLIVNEAGEFYYAPIIFRPASLGETYSLSMTFENGESETVNLTRTVHVRTHAWGAANSIRFENGIPIVSIRRMGNPFNPYAHSRSEALGALSLVEEVRDEPVFILDLRSNEGGTSAFSYMWLYRLLGEVPPANFNWLRFNDSIISAPLELPRPARWYHGFREPAGLYFTYPADLFGHYIHMEPIAENISFTSPQARDRVVSNEQIVIVLVDRFTMSSGETFADQFTNIENTLVIGQNTFGMLLTSGGAPLYLPNSGMPVGLGRHMLVHPEGTWQEGIGFAPDVWVVGDALTAALSLLNELE